MCEDCGGKKGRALAPYGKRSVFISSTVTELDETFSKPGFECREEQLRKKSKLFK